MGRAVASPTLVSSMHVGRISIHHSDVNAMIFVSSTYDFCIIYTKREYICWLVLQYCFGFATTCKKSDCKGKQMKHSADTEGGYKGEGKGTPTSFIGISRIEGQKNEGLGTGYKGWSHQRGIVELADHDNITVNGP